MTLFAQQLQQPLFAVAEGCRACAHQRGAVLSFLQPEAADPSHRHCHRQVPHLQQSDQEPAGLSVSPPAGGAVDHPPGDTVLPRQHLRVGGGSSALRQPVQSVSGAELQDHSGQTAAETPSREPRIGPGPGSELGPRPGEPSERSHDGAPDY